MLTRKKSNTFNVDRHVYAQLISGVDCWYSYGHDVRGYITPW